MTEKKDPGTPFRARLQTFFHPYDPPRVYLFFTSIILKLAGSGISGIGFFMTLLPLTVSGIFVWLLWFVLLFMVAMRAMDRLLDSQQRWMRPVVTGGCGFILAVGFIWGAGILLLESDSIDTDSLSPYPNRIINALRETFGYNDATALCHQAAVNLIQGKNPYAESNIVSATRDYGGSGLKITPLRRGRFADAFPYPGIEEQRELWDEALRHPDVIPIEVESMLNYPSGSFLLLVPFLLAGISDVRIAYILLLVPVLVYVTWRARVNMRVVLVMALLVSLELANLLAIGETGALQYPFLLLGWVLLKKHWRASVVMMGIAITIKQVSWFYMLFYLVLVLRTMGWRRFLASSGTAGGIFMVTNLPFFFLDPRLWLTSLAAPVTDPMFPIGIGIITLVIGGILQFQNSLPFTVMEITVLVAGLAWYYRNCRRYPYTGPLLAVLPFFFAWRSMWSYFFFVDFIILAAVVVNDYSPDDVPEISSPSSG